MTFNSYIFWVFFAVVLGLLRLLPHRAQNAMLVVASYVFYGAWDWRFLGLILLSTVVDYFIGLRVAAAPTKAVAKRWVATSMTVNLSILGFFKYFDFFIENAAAGLSAMGLDFAVPSLGIVLPVGISFYTFQTMSYTVDIYRGETRATRNFVDFALFVAYFPQLVAGPIERSSRLLPQLASPRRVDGDDFVQGLYLIVSGLFMKIVVADNMASIVDAIYGTPTDELSGMAYLVATWCFAIQIYGDFYGYSAIARGVSRWMGVSLMVNFRMPYLATNPSDFWQRWHISLSSWLRDYLYIPLGGNRGGKLLTYRNLMLTMVLGGLWHGAGWTFLIWGTLHGLMLCFYRRFCPSVRLGYGKGVLVRAASAFFFFQLVCVCWLFFRADDLGQAVAIITDICTDFRFTPLAGYALSAIAFFYGPFFVLDLYLEKKGDLTAFTRVRWGWRAAAYAYAFLMIICYAPFITSEFIYFQF